MCFSAVVGVIGALSAASQYAGAQKQAKAAREAARQQALQAQTDARAAAQAAANEIQRDQIATAAAANAKEGAEEVGTAVLDTTPQGETPAARRRVRAQFTGGRGGVGDTGSIRI